MERPDRDMHPASVDGKPRVASRLTNEFNFVFYCDDVTRTPLVFPRTCKCDDPWRQRGLPVGQAAALSVGRRA